MNIIIQRNGFVSTTAFIYDVDKLWAQYLPFDVCCQMAHFSQEVHKSKPQNISRDAVSARSQTERSFYITFFCEWAQPPVNIFACHKFNTKKWHHVFTRSLLLNRQNMATSLPYSNLDSPGLTQIGPLLWQAKQTASVLCQLKPATQVGQSKLALANLGQSTVAFIKSMN